MLNKFNIGSFVNSELNVVVINCVLSLLFAFLHFFLLTFVANSI